MQDRPCRRTRAANDTPETALPGGTEGVPKIDLWVEKSNSIFLYQQPCNYFNACPEKLPAHQGRNNSIDFGTTGRQLWSHSFDLLGMFRKMVGALRGSLVKWDNEKKRGTRFPLWKAIGCFSIILYLRLFAGLVRHENFSNFLGGYSYVRHRKPFMSYLDCSWSSLEQSSFWTFELSRSWVNELMFSWTLHHAFPW